MLEDARLRKKEVTTVADAAGATGAGASERKAEAAVRRAETLVQEVKVGAIATAEAFEEWKRPEKIRNVNRRRGRHFCR